MDKLVYFFKRLIKPYTDPEFWAGIGVNVLGFRIINFGFF